MFSGEVELTPNDCSISCDILSELLEVAIHQILYTRELYPPTAFQSRRKYNISVQVEMVKLKLDTLFYSN